MSSPFGKKKSPFGSGGGDEMSVVDLNLTPLMDVMSNILFFLLASFGAAILSYMAVSVPVQADNENSEPEEARTDKVTANVQLKPDGYRTNLSGDKIEPERLTKFTQTFPKVAGQYDTQALQDWAFRVKEEFPASDTALIVPNDQNNYEDIVQTMDAIKDKKLDATKRMRLLPKLVVADIVKADTVETEGGE